MTLWNADAVTDYVQRFGGMVVPTTPKTAAYTALRNEFVPVNTTPDAVTITLPTAPADRTHVAVQMVTQTSTNAVTIARGGSDTFHKTSGATSLTLTLLDELVVLQYNAQYGIWHVVGGYLPLSALDTRFAAHA